MTFHNVTNVSLIFNSPISYKEKHRNGITGIAQHLYCLKRKKKNRVDKRLTPNQYYKRYKSIDNLKLAQSKAIASFFFKPKKSNKKTSSMQESVG